VLALPVALLFGVTLYSTGRAGQQVSVLWAPSARDVPL